MTALGVVVLIQRLYGFEERDVFRSEDAGWIISSPTGRCLWFISADGEVRYTETGRWYDFEVRP